MNKTLYHHVLDLFAADMRDVLVDILNRLEVAPESPLWSIVAMDRTSSHQRRYVASALAWRAVRLHREDWR